jgi:hypothetical protein
MAIALVSATDLAATDADLPVADLVVTALAPDPAVLVVMDPADLAAMIVVATTVALPVSKTNRSSVP